MPISPARVAAFDILLRVERESSYASELLHAPEAARLSHADHSLATELVMGVLRWRALLDDRIGRQSSRPLAKLDLEVITALRLAAYQMAWLTRIPVRAAIHESVELVKRARKRSSAPFVNAILRKLAQQAPTRAQTEQLASLTEVARELSHPQWLVERWNKEYGLDATFNICRQDQAIPTTSIRLYDAAAEVQLVTEGIELAPGSLLRSARRVLSGDVTGAAAFRDALVSIQDEASQLVATLVQGGTRILDCCAAPGGKTRVIAQRTPGATVAALEVHPHRARLLQKMLYAGNAGPKSSSQQIQIVAADARNLPFTAHFDRILVDVPCSGTGTLSRHPEIKWRLTPKDMTGLHELQCGILRSAMAQIAPGGRLIYSTCSLEREENESVVEKIMAEVQSLRIVDCRLELERLRREGELTWPNSIALTRGPFLRTVPGVHPCDGFFAAILEKS
ncbi:MAG TPA: 16S rRNA (cytosine(967)-C(5))-methyltransferase RsmB [Candidatus Sulfotelmatobacter sp.]|nr:16S rRNA (cytosine(967)-C(5))-methyltransferase RsmB [Candidatus Sulfotelmatobacter sp.]